MTSELSPRTRIALGALVGTPFAHVVLAGALCLALPLLAAGVRASCRVWKQSSADLTPAYATIATLFCIVQPCSYLAWEKYVLPVLPVAAICLWRCSNKPAVALSTRPAIAADKRQLARAA
ncbi:MAG: hypothetical protein JSS27_01935 [Planctomycetes bacterium]|nr:hypothetical protein [Planctomycetota bacterium]